MKLEELMDEELYKQVKAAIDAVNEKEPDKLKHVRFADLSEGAYISRDKYAALETDKSSMSEQLKKAQELIEELKKGTGEDGALQGKIGEYEGTIAALEAENEKLKIEGALKVALLDAGAKASDIDYLMFKSQVDGKELKIGEDGKIKGQDELITGLKTQYPVNFSSGQQRRYQEHRIDLGDDAGDGGTAPKNLAEALKMQFENKE